ncbi:hypothetical protein [Methyloceanibacter sp.]|uniref:hypothetical protein n=1 Tax=Methyloceanibacter sp. TaxID=1965321 RepID=UPI002BF9E4F2|nr:hypothetical protein [Methyloceanibacter sp.]HML92653.1 hypothetical protein [Methyloceanibacter sp.]
MRLVTAFTLLVLICLSPLPGSQDRAAAFTRAPLQGTSLVGQAKFVCGDTAEGYRCWSERGAIRRGKMPKVPNSSSSGTPGSGGAAAGGLWGGGSLWGGGKDDAASSAPSAGSAASAGGCPLNSERLGGHCIPYTQTCKRGLAANAAPQACRSGQEKLVCDFRADGLKDCCCRLYSPN